MNKKILLMAAFVSMTALSSQDVSAKPIPPVPPCYPMERVGTTEYASSTACETACGKDRDIWKCVGIEHNTKFACCAFTN